MFSNKSLGAKFRAEGWQPKKPILIIPGLCSSCLKVVESPHNEWVGKRIWLSMSSIGFDKVWDTMPLFNRKKKKSTLAASTDKSGVMADVDANEKRRWISHMVLKPDGITDPDGIKLRPVKGIKGCAYLDPGAITNSLSYVFGPFAEMLQDAGYIEEINLNAVPYDWRLPPHRLEERDGYFSDVQHIIETMVKQNGQKVVVVAHSLGNRVMHYFCRFMEKKMGRQWMSDHVDNWVALGPLWLGSPKLLRAMVSGDRMGLEAFLFPHEGIQLGRSLGSSAWMFPYVTYEHEFQTYCQLYNKKTKRFENKTNQEILCESGAEVVWKKFVDYYDDHELVGKQDMVLAPPPVDKLYAIYGINLKTETYFFFKKAKSAKSATDFVLDSSGSIPNLKCEGGVGYETRDTKQNVLKGKPRSGDGTVPYASLAYCKKWSKKVDVRVAEIEGAEHREILKNKQMWQLVLECAMHPPKPTALPATFVDASYDVKLQVKGKFVSRTISFTKTCFLTTSAKSAKAQSRLLYDKVDNIDMDQNGGGFRIDFENISIPYVFKSSQSQLIVNELAARCRYVRDIQSTHKEDRNEYGQTPLHLAVIDNSVELIIDLIKSGSDVNAVDLNGSTPLMTAAEKGRLHAMLILMQTDEIEVNKNNNSNQSVVHKMVQLTVDPADDSLVQQWCGVMQSLKRHGCSLEDKAEMGETPLHHAVKRSNQMAVVWLGDNGGNVNATNSLKETPLHYAVRTGQIHIVKLLLDRGANTHISSHQKETPLAMAKKTNDDIFKAMSSFHASKPFMQQESRSSVISVRDEYGQTAMHRAAYEDRLDTVFEILLDKEAAEQIHDTDKNGWTPLHSAAAQGNLDVLLVLLNVHGIDVNRQTNNGTSVLHYVMRKRFEVKRDDTYIDVLNKMRDKGCQLNITAKRKFTPLHEACLHANVIGAKWLLMNGAKSDCLTSAGENPVHFAVRSSDVAMVKLMLEFGVSVHVKAEREGTPLELAQSVKNQKIIDVLEAVSSGPQRASRRVSKMDRRTALFEMTSSNKYIQQDVEAASEQPEDEEELVEKFELENDEEEEEEAEATPDDNVRYRRMSVINMAPISRDRSGSVSVFSKSDYVPQAATAAPAAPAADATPPPQQVHQPGSMPRITPGRGRGRGPPGQAGRAFPRGRGQVRGRGQMRGRGRGQPRGRGHPVGRMARGRGRGAPGSPANAHRGQPRGGAHAGPGGSRIASCKRPSLQKPSAAAPPPQS